MKVRVNITLDEETNNKLRELAQDYHTNLSQMVTYLVWEKDKQDKRTKKG